MTIPSEALFDCYVNAVGLKCKNMTVHTGATIYVNVSTDVTINGNWRSLWEATWITAVMFTSRGTW